MDELLRTANEGQILRRGIRAAIVGRPNVGKSSLLNQLLGHDRAIVTVPGTTRDTIEETANIRGLPVVFVDIAGLRAAGDSIEAEGIRWSAQRAVHVINVSAGPVGECDGAAIEDAIRSAITAGAIVVAPAPDGPGSWTPPALPGLVVVGARPDCPLDGLRRLEGHRDGLAASPESAPFAGIPPEHAPCGVSFAVARVSAWVCRARQLLPDGHAMDVRDALGAVCDW